MQRTYLSLVWSVVLASSAVLAACSDDKTPVDTGTLAQLRTMALPLEAPPAPDDDPATTEKAELGRLLFWDPVLSGNRDIACATCHHPDFAYADDRTLSVGTGGTGLGPQRAVGVAPHRTTRNAMTILNAAWNGLTVDGRATGENAPMFWDDRAHSLESQALGPTSAQNEMRGTAFDETTIFPELVTRLQAIPVYVAYFESAFGAEGVTKDNVARAIASFERTLVDHDSSYDRYARGDATAMTTKQIHGLEVFADSGCTGCHTGPMFSDFEMHVIERGRGRGRGNAGAATPLRTASLRNVTRTAPYMDDGDLEDLDDVFQLYQRVDKQGDAKLRAVNVPNGSDRDDVKAFLGAISDGTYDRTIPTDVPSGLPVGGSIAASAR